MVHNRSISTSPEIREPPQTVEIVVSVPTVVKAVGIFFALILVYLVRDALLSIALSAVFILGLDPPVSALERRGWGRGRAALAIFAVIAIVVFGIVVWAVKPVWAAIGGFVDDLPAYIDKAQHSGVLQDVDKSTDAFKKLESVAADAAKNLPEAAINLLGAAAGALGSVFQLVTLTFLTLFGLLAEAAAHAGGDRADATAAGGPLQAHPRRGLQRRLLHADRQHRDLGHRRHRRRRGRGDRRRALADGAGAGRGPARPDPADRGHDRRGHRDAWSP